MQHTLCILAVSVPLIALAAPAGAITLTPIASTGSAAGDTGQTFTRFNARLQINAAGKTVFLGFTTPDGSRNDSGIFVGAPAGGTTTVAFEGEAAGDRGQIFRSFIRGVKLNDAVQTAFFAITTPDSDGNFRGSFLGTPSGGNTIVAFRGDPAGGTGQTFRFFDGALHINDAGQTLIRGFLSGRGGFGIFLSDPAGGTTTVASRGDAAGDTDQTFWSFALPSSLNRVGQSTFSASTRSDSGDRSRGIFRGEPTGGTTTVALRGDAVGRTGRTFTELRSPQLNDAGQVAFWAETTPYDSGNNTGIFLDDPISGITTVAFEGDAAGGTDQTFTGFYGGVKINNDGQTIFYASTTPDSSGNDVGVFLGTPTGGTVTVAFEGDAAGGTGQTFMEVSMSHLNDAGQVAFIATLSDARRGVFVRDGEGEILDVLLTGETLNDATGAQRTISEISNIVLSDYGIAMHVEFVGGGEGIFVAAVDPTVRVR
ncbi:MAG: choice-of-anchor tandem repeat NxxGxxAF-containing protein [Pseudomonadota bacterium]